MSTPSLRRLVVVYRTSEYRALVLRHGTREQAAFVLAQGRGASDSQSRGSFEELERLELEFQRALGELEAHRPARWRFAQVNRSDLSRFLFQPDDVVAIVGQDGLVANTAHYLTGQPVLGINPSPQAFDGVLVKHETSAIADLLRDAARDRLRLEQRTMVAASLGDTQTLEGLNELFIGHRSHQSARYTLLSPRDGAMRSEHQSSSGVIVATGTGATGWASSIHRATKSKRSLPAPTDPRLCFFVREAFKSRTSNVSLCEGDVTPQTPLEIHSRMSEGGVLFGDGIESDALEFPYGAIASITVSNKRLALAA